MTNGWRFDNTYSKLPEPFLSNTLPTPVKLPEIIILNDNLVDELGLNFSKLSKEKILLDKFRLKINTKKYTKFRHNRVLTQLLISID